MKEKDMNSLDHKDKLNGGKSMVDWMFDAVNGNVKTYGLELLDKKD